MTFNSGINSFEYGLRSGVSAMIFVVIALVLAIVATVLALVFIVPEKRRESLNAFGKFLHDTCNFKYLLVEKILQALYIFATAFVVLNGFFTLFQHFLTGLLTMLLGPIVIRLVYELLMMIVLLLKNVIMINKKIKDQNGDTEGHDVFAGPDLSGVQAELRQRREAAQAAASAPVAPAPSVPTASETPAVPHFCAHCGSPLDAQGHCPQCGQ